MGSSAFCKCIDGSLAELPDLLIDNISDSDSDSDFVEKSRERKRTKKIIEKYNVSYSNNQIYQFQPIGNLDRISSNPFLNKEDYCDNFYIKKRPIKSRKSRIKSRKRLFVE